MHDDVWRNLVTARRTAQDTREAAAQPGATDEERQARIRALELEEERLRGAEAAVRTIRESIRLRGFDPGELHPEDAYLDAPAVETTFDR